MNCGGCGGKRKPNIEIVVDFEFQEDYPVQGTPETFQAVVQEGRAIVLMNKTRGPFEKAVRDGSKIVPVHIVYRHGDKDRYLNSQNLYGVYVMVQSPAQNAAGAKKLIVVPQRKPEPMPEIVSRDVSGMKVGELREMIVAMGAASEQEVSKMRKKELLKFVI